MKSILSICVFLLVFNIKGFSQQNVNAYKYVVVPNSFNFLNEPNQYQTNALAKFLFEKYGFNALMAEDEFPEDLNNNRCLALYADVEKRKAFLNTKLQVHLRDCNNKVVFSSDIGQSREKEFDKVYNLALRDAFESFETLNYTYEPHAKILAQSTSTITDAPKNTAAKNATEQELERLREQVASLKLKQDSDGITVVAPTDTEAIEKVEKKIEKEAKTTVKEETKADEAIQTLFASPVDNGYTITDASSKILYHLVFSGKENVYIVKGQDAIVYKMNTTWIISKATDNGVSMTTLKVDLN